MSRALLRCNHQLTFVRENVASHPRATVFYTSPQNTEFGAAERHYLRLPRHLRRAVAYHDIPVIKPAFQDSEFNMFDHAKSENYIPYGRGGAGNMRMSCHQNFVSCKLLTQPPGTESSIREAWFKIAAKPDQHPLVLTSSPEGHYANSKSERHSSSSLRRRSTVSSSWSLSSSSTREHTSSWKQLFRRKSENDSIAEKTS
jgi:hypothetical protein